MNKLQLFIVIATAVVIGIEFMCEPKHFVEMAGTTVVSAMVLGFMFSVYE